MRCAEKHRSLVVARIEATPPQVEVGHQGVAVAAIGSGVVAEFWTLAGHTPGGGVQSCFTGRMLPPGRLSWILSLAALAGCGWTVSVNSASIPCPEISEAMFASSLRGGAVRGDVEVRGAGSLASVQTVIGANALSTCQPAATPGGNPACRLSRDLVLRYATGDRGVFFVQVPAGRWYRILKRNPPGACRMLP